MSTFDKLRACPEKLRFRANPDHLQVLAIVSTEPANHSITLLDVFSDSFQGTGVITQSVNFHVLACSQTLAESHPQ